MHSQITHHEGRNSLAIGETMRLPRTARNDKPHVIEEYNDEAISLSELVNKYHCKMKLRIHDKWTKKDRESSLEDNATALAYTIWQIALTATKNLYVEDFEFENDEQRLGVIAEYQVFLIHCSDRLAFERMDTKTRETFITVLAKESARHLQRNKADVFGRGDYKTSFFELLNERGADYAQCAFENNKPGYALLRAFGEKVQNIMGSTQTNRWVIDQVMEIDGLEAIEHFAKSMQNLLSIPRETL